MPYMEGQGPSIHNLLSGTGSEQRARLNSPAGRLHIRPPSFQYRTQRGNVLHFVTHFTSPIALRFLREGEENVLLEHELARLVLLRC